MPSSGPTDPSGPPGWADRQRGQQPPEPYRSAQLRAYWADRDTFANHPELTEFVRRTIPHEVGPEGGIEAAWARVRLVLVRRMGAGLSRIRVPLLEGQPHVADAHETLMWQFAEGRPSARRTGPAGRHRLPEPRVPPAVEPPRGPYVPPVVAPPGQRPGEGREPPGP